MRIFLSLVLLFLAVGISALDLTRAETLLALQNPEGAKRVLAEQYAQTADKSEKEQIQFILAQIALKQGKQDEAAAIYRRMLTSNPALSRVRLELGYLYFLQKKDDQARYHLRLVLAEKELPASVRKNVQYMLEAIRRRRAWQLYVSVGMAPDSNVNTMSGRRLDPERVTVIAVVDGMFYRYGLSVLPGTGQYRVRRRLSRVCVVVL